MFSKNKKDGREEFPRARIEKGHVKLFPSEGSGRISGLHWANGLVRLAHDAQTVKEGDLVQYIPFSAWLD